MGLFSFLNQNKVVTRKELASSIFNAINDTHIEECCNILPLEKRILISWLYYRELTVRDSVLNPNGLAGVALDLIKLLASDVKSGLSNMKDTNLDDISESLLETFALAKIHFDKGDIDSVPQVLLEKDDVDTFQCMTLCKLEVEEKIENYLIGITING